MPTSSPGSFAVRALLSAACGLATIPALAGAQATGTALVRHAPSINGTVDGSVQQMLAEGTTLNGGATVTGDLLVPGTPNVATNGNPDYGGTLNGSGNASPTNFQVTLNGNVTLGHVIRRTNAVNLPAVAPSPSPGGTRNVSINTAGQSVGDWATLRNLTLNGNAGNCDLPAGTYGDFLVNGNSSVTLGVPGATQPSVYHFQRLTLNGRAQLRVVGPVIVTSRDAVVVNGTIGLGSNPSWLSLRISSGGLLLNGNASAYGYFEAPNGAVIINGNTQLLGGVVCDRLTVNGNGLLRLFPIQTMNQPPAAIAPSSAVTTNEDTSTTIVLAGFDPENAPLTYQVVSGPLHGTLTPPAGGAAERAYQPAADFHGQDALTFKVSDGALDSALVTVPITVLPVNDPPVADDVAAQTSEDIAVSVQLSGLDVETTTGLTFQVTAPPAHGTLSFLTDDAVAYTPATNYHGTDSFTYIVSDGALNSSSATATIVVSPVNDAPFALADEETVTEDGQVALTLTAVDIDTSAEQLTYEIVTGPFFGTLAPSGAQPPAPFFTYAPQTDFSATDSFTFRVFDGEFWSAPATFLVHVTNLNDAPTALSQSVEVNEDETVEFTVTGDDNDADPLTFTIITPPEFGMLSAGGVPITTFPLAGINSGALSYTPGADYHGPDSFTFRSHDGLVDSATAIVSIVVAPVNDAPTANAQAVTIDEDQPAEITMTGADVEGSALTFFITVDPQHGTLSPLLPGQAVYTYLPEPNSAEPDRFSFRVRDGELESAETVVTIVINPVNDPPEAIAQPRETDEDVSVAVSLAAIDVDTPQTSLVYTIVTQPAFGAITPTSGGPEFIYQPSDNYHGADSFTFTVSDGHLTSPETTLPLTVLPVNDAPQGVGLTLETIHDQALPLTLNAIDVDGDALTYAVSAPQNGTLTLTGAPGGPHFSYTPDAGFIGTDSFTFTVDDGVTDPVIGSAVIAVVNHAPVAFDAPLFVAEDVAQAFVLTATDQDADALIFTIVDQPQHGQLSGVAPNLVYTPAPEYHGNDSLTFAVSDGASSSGTASISIAVASMPDAPIVEASVSTPAAVASTADAITVTAQASSVDGAIVRVEFFDGVTKLGETTGEPHVFVWSNSAPGEHELWVRAHDAAGGVSDSSRTQLTVLAGLPYVADFEAAEGYHVGGVDGQLGWSATGSVEISADTAASGTQALSLLGGVVIPEATQIIAPGGQAEVAFVDYFVRPVAGLAPAGAVSFDGQAAILAAVAVNPEQGELYVWNGDGGGGGTWVATGSTFATDAARKAVAWLRYTLRKDYARKEWDLYVDGQMVRSGLRFVDDDVDRLGRLMFVGPMAGAAYVDDVYAGAENPLFADLDHDGIDDTYESGNGMNPDANDRDGDLDADGLTNMREFMLGTRANAADSDNDGVPDVWELEHGRDPNAANADGDADDDGISDAREFELGTDPANSDSDADGMPDGWEIAFGLDPRNDADGAGDADGDGLSNQTEYMQGTDLRDYYNGVLPVVTSLVPAGGELGPNDELSVLITAPDGSPLVNAPVTVNATEGGHLLARSPAEPGQTSIEVRTGADGVATVYVKPGN